MLFWLLHILKKWETSACKYCSTNSLKCTFLYRLEGLEQKTKIQNKKLFEIGKALWFFKHLDRNQQFVSELKSPLMTWWGSKYLKRIDFPITASSHHSEEHAHLSPSRIECKMNHFCLYTLESNTLSVRWVRIKKSSAFFSPLYLTRCTTTRLSWRFPDSKLALGKGTIWRRRCIESSSFRHLERSAARNWCRARTHPELLRVRRVHRWRRSRCSARRRRHRTAAHAAMPRALDRKSSLADKTRFAVPAESCLLAQVHKSDAATGKTMWLKISRFFLFLRFWFKIFAWLGFYIFCWELGGVR